MKKLYFFILSSLFTCSVFSQTVEITAGASGSGTSQNVIVGGSAYHVIEAIYTATEIGTNFLTAGSEINKVGFYVSATGTPTLVNNYKIYLKNIPSTTSTLTAGTYTTTGYTLVYTGSIDFATTGFVGVMLTTPFLRTAGSNLQILVERLGNETSASVFTFATANGNQTSGTITTSRRYNGTTAPSASTSLTASAFRPAIQLMRVSPIDAAVSDIIKPTASCYNTPQTIGVEVYNNGINPIAPGSVSVSYKISGANSFSGVLTNTTTIAAGGTETVNFAGINLNNSGINNDTALVTISGDGDITNDTLYSTINTSVLALPQTEGAETTLPVFSNIRIVEGTRQLWRLQTGKYGNADMSVAPVNDSIVPRAPGNKFYLFDAYSGSSSVGTVNQLFSQCLQMPTNTSSVTNNTRIKFWMTHDTVFSSGTNLSPDSMYVSVSTDKGVTWTRLSGFARIDPTAVINTWKQHEVSLNAYNNGQSIQIAFEGVSYYGNVIGIDDIEIKSCQSATTTISYNGSPLCSNAGVVPVTFSGVTGGTYSATPAGLSLSASTGAINTGSSNAGTYTVTYTIAATADCPAITATATVVITALPTATISYNQPFCNNVSTTQNVTITGNTGGVFSAGTGLAINTFNGTINPASSTVGTYTVTYTIAANGGCPAVNATASVTINAAPTATISYSGPYCTSLSVPQAVNQTGASGGTYSASPNGLSINASTGAITPSTSTAGNYTVTYTIAASGGCSVVTATATISIASNPSATISYPTGICAESATPVNVTFSGTSGGVYSSSTGLSINPTTGAINPSASTAGTYTVTYAIASGGGCNAFNTTANVTINQGTFNTTSVTECDSYTWSANGQTYTTSGTYTHSYTNGSGCPSADYLNLTINNGTFNTESQTACSSYTWAMSGQTYTTSGVYTHTYTNGNGCPSAHYLNLTIDNGTFNTTTLTACNTYTWPANGQTYTTAGSYTHTYTNANGCASADYLNLTIASTIFNNINESACNSYTWSTGTGQTYTSSGTYTYNGTAVGGCDSIVYLTLTIRQSSSSSETASACNTYTWNGNTYTNSGSYTFTTTNAAGCDSVVTLALTINTGTFNTTTIARCQSYTWPANGITYTTGGTYTYSYTNGNGCASADYLILTIGNTPVTVNISQTSCNSYSWNGTTYTTGGTYTWTGTSTTGCDSIVYLNLTINNSTSSSFATSGCETVTLPWGQTVTATGAYNHTYQTTLGCDSVVTANVTILEGTNTVQALTVTAPYNFHGQTYLESGSYTYSYTNANGCASTDVLNLTVNAPKGGVTLYPNPNRGLFQIIVTGDFGSRVNVALVNVFDTRGRKIMTQKMNTSSSGMIQVNLTMLPKGIYQIEVVDDSGKRLTTDKMIIQ